MNSPDDELADDDDPSSGVDPSIDDPNWAANIVERAVRKAELEQSSGSAAAAKTADASPPDVPSPTRSQPSERSNRQDDASNAAAPPADTRSAPRPPAASPTAVPDSYQPGSRHAATATALAEGDSAGVDDDFIQHADEVLGDDDSGIRIRQLVEWIVVVVGALVVALVIKAFLIQPFYIPSGSMSPTLNKDDRILVNKLSYDLHEVNRGDIVVFDTPENFPNRDVDNLVKRVIGLEGETIDFSDGRVVIDDRLLEEPYIGEDIPSTWTAGLPPGCISERTDTKRGCTIPEGHVFVMGDNRTGSDDGRVFGPIPEDLIVGRAFLRVWPLGELGFL